MKLYEFVVTLSKGTPHSDDLVDALFEAGCDDGSVWSRGEMVHIGFSREANSLEEAIRSAIGDVQRRRGGRRSHDGGGCPFRTRLGERTRLLAHDARCNDGFVRN